MLTFLRTTGFKRLKGFIPAMFIIILIMVILAGSGTFFFLRGQMVMSSQLKDKLRSTATAAAMQFDADTIRHIRDGDTVATSAALLRVASQLQSIRDNITNINSAYIMQQTPNPAFLKFIADADMMQTDEQLDHNHNGIVDDDEKAPKSGELYDWKEFPVLGQEAFLHPTVDDHIATDQWGTTISGYAPIRMKDGQTVGVLGIDMAADEYSHLTQSIFSPVAFLLLILASFCLGCSTILVLWARRIESLERLEIERTGLLRLAFHQLGGPLTIISWSLEELETDGQQSIQRTIVNIHEGVKRLTNILKTLKEADIVHAGRIDYKPEFASLTDILKDVVKDAGERLLTHKQTVEMSLAENITMNLDPKLIAGVAQELLTNAMDFSPNGAVIKMRSHKEGSTATFEIEDFGCGIPKRDIARIFEEFTRGSNATKFKADGNGLGLYIVEGIVKRSGGTIDIKSREGKGTTVTVRLPIV